MPVPRIDGAADLTAASDNKSVKVPVSAPIALHRAGKSPVRRSLFASRPRAARARALRRPSGHPGSHPLAAPALPSCSRCTTLTAMAGKVLSLDRWDSDGAGWPVHAKAEAMPHRDGRAKSRGGAGARSAEHGASYVAGTVNVKRELAWGWCLFLGANVAVATSVSLPWWRRRRANPAAVGLSTSVNGRSVVTLARAV
jgi:hypothetical protein